MTQNFFFANARALRHLKGPDAHNSSGPARGIRLGLHGQRRHLVERLSPPHIQVASGVGGAHCLPWAGDKRQCGQLACWGWSR